MEQYVKEVQLGGTLSLEQFMSVVRGHAKVTFSPEYIQRVNECRTLVEKWVAEKRVMYGTTTGFGSLVSQVIPPEDAETLQRNIILTHSTSVGEPLEQESVRGIMLMVLQSLGKGVSGVRIGLMELYRQMLNRDVTPWAPSHGSVGYLCVEAHIAMVAIGGGKAWYGGELLEGREALSRAGLTPWSPSYKEGLSLTNGTLSPTALSAIAIYDLMNCAKAADVAAAVSVEALGGLPKAYEARIMGVRPQPEQAATADNLLRLLSGSQVVQANQNSHVQDALSLRCIPQAHGAVKLTLDTARKAIENDLNGCCDNPIFFPEGDDGVVLSNGNPDAAFQGIQMDSCCIAATYLAKMSERRNTRFIDSHLSGYPSYLVKKPGFNSGLMIPQYSQAGILNEMRMLATPATIDNVTTSGNQEDYVSMGYNACRKAQKAAKLLEYVLAIEMMSGYQAQQFMDTDLKRGAGTAAVLALIGDHVPVMEEDMYLYPHLESIRDLIHSGEFVSAAEKAAGTLRL
jgi:histidine ammonia-lyase